MPFCASESQLTQLYIKLASNTRWPCSIREKVRLVCNRQTTWIERPSYAIYVPSLYIHSAQCIQIKCRNYVLEMHVTEKLLANRKCDTDTKHNLTTANYISVFGNAQGQNPLDAFPRHFPVTRKLTSCCQLVADLLATRRTILTWYQRFKVLSVRNNFLADNAGLSSFVYTLLPPTHAN